MLTITKPEGNLFKDRFVSLQHRALIEPRAPVMYVTSLSRLPLANIGSIALKSAEQKLSSTKSTRGRGLNKGFLVILPSSICIDRIVRFALHFDFPDSHSLLSTIQLRISLKGGVCLPEYLRKYKVR